MPKCVLLSPLKLLEHRTYRREKLMDHSEFFAPRSLVPPYACSIKIMRHILANAKCNFAVKVIFQANTIRRWRRCNQPMTFSDRQRHYSEPETEGN